MKIKEPGTSLFSGKLGNMVYYVVDGKQYMRRAAIPGKKRKTEVSGITPARQKTITRFSEVQSYYAFFRKYVAGDIWKLAGQAEHVRADNLFHRTNSACFNEKGDLVDFATFSFSRGELQLPRNISVEGEGGHYRVRWEEERNGLMAAPEDRLCVGVIYEARQDAPRMVTEVSGKRSDLAGSFTLDNAPAGVTHVYCFWMREDGTAYSPSRHFEIGK